MRMRVIFDTILKESKESSDVKDLKSFYCKKVWKYINENNQFEELVVVMDQINWDGRIKMCSTIQ